MLPILTTTTRPPVMTRSNAPPQRTRFAIFKWSIVMRTCMAATVIAALVPVESGQGVGPGGGEHGSAESPVKLIFDTDMGNDCDDVQALAMIHALQSRGECELLAVTVTKDHTLAAPFVDVINTFYGRGDIPIGVCHSGVTPHEGKFNPLAKPEFGFDHDLRSGDDAPDAVKLLRQTLTNAPDQSVVLVQVGFSTNLANLLRSPPDDIVDVTGDALVRRKVRSLSIMAGAFTQIVGDSGHLYDHVEYNVIKDLPAAKTLAEHWPTDIVWSGFEIGRNLRYPHQSILNDYDYVDRHPVAEAYVRYNPPPHDRPTWDLTSVLYAVRPDAGYFDLSPRGTVGIDDRGLTTLTAQPNGRDRHLIIPDDGSDRIIEALVGLASQPPTKSNDR